MIKEWIFILIVMLPFSHAVISCVVACNRCHSGARMTELMEVYCAMCEECKARRREWVTNSDDGRRAQIVSAEEDCPPQPVCDSEEQLLSVIETTTTTTTTTTKPTTTHRTCPPVIPCKTTKAFSFSPNPCCMPYFMYPPPMPMMCPMPCNNPLQTYATIQQPLHYVQKKKVTSSKHSASSDSLYLYIGVPKDVNNVESDYQSSKN